MIKESHPCPYIPGNSATTMWAEQGEQTMKSFIETGWCRFGTTYEKPACASCNKCKSLRVKVKDFVLSKSFRRVLKKYKHLRIKVQEPTMTDTKFDMYKNHKNISAHNLSKHLFKYYIVDGGGQEFTYYDKNKMVGLGYTDGNRELYSRQFYFDPEYSGLGTFSILKEIQYCLDNDIEYYYLGHIVYENQHLKYKARFKPYELLDYKTGEWHAE